VNNNFLEEVERSRIETQAHIADEKKKLAEQYFTPARVSNIMSQMFTRHYDRTVLTLDPCCGVGNLAASVLSTSKYNGEKQHITLVEKDSDLYSVAISNFNGFAEIDFINMDFFEWSHIDKLGKFDRIILNPPYAKISSNSDLYKSLKRRLGYSETNIYSAFVSCCLTLLSDIGELVAIIPRSFCNGPTFRGFRHFILRDFFIHQLYLFESRRIFSESNVLQEVIIIKISKSPSEKTIISHERLNGKTDSMVVGYEKIFFSSDHQKFIHIPLAVDDDGLLSKVSRYQQNLLSLGLRASTGKVVDFRCEKFLQKKKSKSSVNLIYQDNIAGSGVLSLTVSDNIKKRYIKMCEESKNILIPSGNYVLIRRMSFKESSTRVVATPILSKSMKDKFIGIENHINYIWGEKIKLNENICVAVFSYISTPTIDKYFRRFSGHTQINATDLNSLPMPELEVLEDFGIKYSGYPFDELIELAEKEFFY